MTRKFKLFALAAALSAAAGTASAQDFVFGWNPRSGDVWVDTQLDDMNRYGYRYREPFVDEMVRYYGAPRDLVTGLLVNQRWAPGDVYYAGALAQVIGRPCRYVVQEWERDHGQGWGVIAQRLGIKPGSAEFHRLKRGFVPTYDRWGRPIRIDDGLREFFPDRGRAGPRGFDARVLVGDDRGNRGRGNDKPGRGNDGVGRGNDKARGGPPAGKGNDKARGNDDGPGNSGNKGKGNDKGNKGKGKD